MLTDSVHLLSKPWKYSRDDSFGRIRLLGKSWGGVVSEVYLTDKDQVPVFGQIQKAGAEESATPKKLPHVRKHVEALHHNMFCWGAFFCWWNSMRFDKEKTKIGQLIKLAFFWLDIQALAQNNVFCLLSPRKTSFVIQKRTQRRD